MTDHTHDREPIYLPRWPRQEAGPHTSPEELGTILTGDDVLPYMADCFNGTAHVMVFTRDDTYSIRLDPCASPSCPLPVVDFQFDDESSR